MESKTKVMCECKHPKSIHNIDSFGRFVCDHAIDNPNGTYFFDCDCMQFKEVSPDSSNRLKPVVSSGQ